jgi:hypothetical protein
VNRLAEMIGGEVEHVGLRDIDNVSRRSLSYDRIRRDLAERGVPLAMGSLVDFVERAADLLAPIDGLHWKRLLAGSWMATDGTGLKVIVPGLPSAHDGYIELYRNAECAVFQYAAHKGSDDVVAKLARFRGTLTADAEHRFNAVYATGNVIEAGCNAHGRRKFRDAEDTQPVLAVEGGAFIGAMYGEEEKAQKLALSGEALRSHRETHIRPIAAEFRKTLLNLAKQSACNLLMTLTLVVAMFSSQLWLVKHRL